MALSANQKITLIIIAAVAFIMTILAGVVVMVLYTEGVLDKSKTPPPLAVIKTRGLISVTAKADKPLPTACTALGLETLSVRTDVQTLYDTVGTCAFSGCGNTLLWLANSDGTANGGIRLYAMTWVAPEVITNIGEFPLVLSKDTFAGGAQMACMSGGAVAFDAVPVDPAGETTVAIRHPLNAALAWADTTLAVADSAPVAMAYDATHSELVVAWKVTVDNTVSLRTYVCQGPTVKPQARLTFTVAHVPACIAVVGDTMVIGCTDTRVIQYSWSRADARWVLVTTLSGANAFGASVALSANQTRLAVGDPDGNGTVSLFAKNGSGVFVKTFDCVNNSGNVSATDAMGTTVAWVGADTVYAGCRAYPKAISAHDGTQTQYTEISDLGDYRYLGASMFNGTRTLLGLHNVKTTNGVSQLKFLTECFALTT